MRRPLEVCLDSAVGELQDVVACRFQEFLRIHLVKPFLGCELVLHEFINGVGTRWLILRWAMLGDKLKADPS